VTSGQLIARRLCSTATGLARIGRKSPRRTAGRQYTKDSYNKAIRRACEAADVEIWSPNQLRHTRATEIRRDHGLEACQVILGHSRADVTQVYAERDHAKAREVMSLVG
jgi:integrase